MMKPKIYLASSALKSENYDFIRTIEEALKNNFSGVQLYLKDDFCDLHYLEETSLCIKENQLDILIHLPDEFEEKYIFPTQKLLKHSKQKRALIHFFEGMEIPKIPCVEIGLENAISGYNEKYYSYLFKTIRKKNTFFTFDIPRLFGTTPRNWLKIDNFIKETLSKRNTSKNVIHLIDISVPAAERDQWCSLGNGLLTPHLKDIIKFKGAIVLEFEDLKMALESKNRLGKLSEDT